MDEKKKIEIGLLAFIAVLVVCMVVLIIINGKPKSVNNNAEVESSRYVKQESTEDMTNVTAESESTENETANTFSELEITSEYQKDYSQLRMDSYVEALKIYMIT